MCNEYKELSYIQHKNMSHQNVHIKITKLTTGFN